MWTTMLLKQWIFLPSRVLRKDLLTRLALHLHTTVSSLLHLLFQLVQAAINATEEMPCPPNGLENCLQEDTSLNWDSLSIRYQSIPSGYLIQVSGSKVSSGSFSTAPTCQELKSMRTPALLPDSIMARLRPSPRTGSTAVVLWKPPPASGSLLPDLVWPLYPKVSLTLFESFPFWKFTCSRLVLPYAIPNKGLLDVAGIEHGAIVR